MNKSVGNLGYVLPLGSGVHARPPWGQISRGGKRQIRARSRSLPIADYWLVTVLLLLYVCLSRDNGGSGSAGTVPQW
jgi:hypothetical protein